MHRQPPEAILPARSNLSNAESRPLLISHSATLADDLQLCPNAKTLTGYSEQFEASVLIQIRCKQWACPHCGRRKVAHYAARVAAAEPQRFVTLTVDPKQHETPRAAHEHASPRISKLIAIWRKRHGPCEYFRVLELTKNGWPHYHFLQRGSYISQAELSTEWATLSGAPIVDIRKIQRTADCYWYLTKYLSKLRYIHWITRRCTWSRAFWKDQQFKGGTTLGLLVSEVENAHPADWLKWNHCGRWVQRITADAFLLSPSRSKAEN